MNLPFAKNINKIIKKSKKLFLNNKKTVIAILALFFIGFCIERVKNNYAFFVTSNLPSFDLRLSDHATEDTRITGEQTFASGTSSFMCDFYIGFGEKPVTIRSILIDAEYSSEQIYLQTNAIGNASGLDAPLEKWTTHYITNASLSDPPDDNQKNAPLYMRKRLTASDATKRLPLVIPYNVTDVRTLRIIFAVEPKTDFTMKVNRLIINPKPDFLFMFRPAEFLGASCLLILLFLFVFILPPKEKNTMIESVNYFEGYTKKPENMFCKLAFIFGMIFVFLTPPLQVPDEDFHFANSYSLSRLNIFRLEEKDKTAGVNVPYEYTFIRDDFWGKYHNGFASAKYSYSEFLKYKNLRLGGKEVFQKTIFAPVPALHLPQAIGMFVLRLCENLFFLRPANVLDMFYAGRIFNLLFYICIGYFSIKTIPFYKYVIASILLLPESISLAASLSYDSVIIGLSIFLICLLLKCSLSKEYQISKKEAWILLILAPLIINMKHVYFAIFLILFFMRQDKFKLLFSNVNNTKKKKTLYISVLILISAFSFFLWNILIANIRIIAGGGISFSGNEPNVSGLSIKRVLDISTNTDFFRLLFHDLFNHRGYFLEGVVGLFGWVDGFFPEIFALIAVFFTTVLSALDSNPENTLQPGNKILYLSIYVICLLLITITMHIAHGYDPFTMSLIQGRYFIPVLPLFFTMFYTRLPLSHKSYKTISPVLNRITPCFVCFSLTLSMFFLIFRFYS